MNHISAYCLLSDHTIRKNGKLLFEDKNGDLPDFLLSAYHHLGLNYPRFHKMDRLSRLGWLATEVLLAGEPAGDKDLLPEQIGLVLTNANSSLDTDLKYFESARHIPSPSLFVYTLPNIVIGEICIRNNFKGEGAFFITETFDAGFLAQYVDNLLDSAILQLCICGWVDVLEEEYKAALFLVEKASPEKASTERSGAEKSKPFTTETIDKLFRTENE